MTSLRLTTLKLLYMKKSSRAKSLSVIWIFVLLYLIISLSCIRQPVSEKELDKNWQFSQAGRNDNHKATVPGVVQTDLLNNKLIEDPFFGINEQKLQWIGETDWVYKTTFTADKDLLENEHIEIVFMGLDTYADVYLNGKPVLKTDNMFRKWEVDCKSLLVDGMNTLEVHFAPSERLDSIQAENQSIALPDMRSYTRKAPYQSGWDWGPKLPPIGIWKDARLAGYSKARLDSVQISQKHLFDGSVNVAAQVSVQQWSQAGLQLCLTLCDPQGKTFATTCNFFF